MRVLVFSDLHLHEWPYAATVNKEGLNSRLVLQRRSIQYMIQSQAPEVDAVVFCGDFFHRHGVVTTPVLSVAVEILETIAKYFHKSAVTFLVGNHDMGNSSGSLHALNILKPYGTVVPPRSFSFNNRLYPMNFVGYTDNPDELKANLKQTKPGLLFMHQGVSGVPVDNGFILKNEILTPDLIPDHIEMAFTGHYHSQTKVTDKLYVVGAPHHHTRGDHGDRGWRVYDTVFNTVQTFMSGDPEFVTIEFKDALNTIVEGDFVRVVNADGEAEEIRRVLMDKGALAVEVLRAAPAATQPAVVGKPSLTMRSVVEDFKKRVSKTMPKRFNQVGDEVMEGRYETPKIPGN